MAESLWLGFVPPGTNIPVGISEGTPAGAALYARLRLLFEKEITEMTATAAPPVGDIAGLSLGKRLVDAATRAFKWVGGVFMKAAGWVKTAATKTADFLHLGPAWAFVKNMATSFGPVGWFATGIAVMASEGGRKFASKTVNWVIDRATWLVTAPLDLVGLHKAADWVADFVERSRAATRRGLTWLGDRGDGRVRRVFDPAGTPMKLTFLGAGTVAFAKFFSILPVPAPVRWIAFAICWVVLGLAMVEVEDEMEAEVASDEGAAAAAETVSAEPKTVTVTVPTDGGEAQVLGPDGKPLTAAQLAAEGIKVETSNGSTPPKQPSGRGAGHRTPTQTRSRPAAKGGRAA